MYITITMEDLTGNALIECYKHYNKTFVSYAALEKYGQTVVDILYSQGHDACIYFSKENTEQMLQAHCDIFEEVTKDGQLGVALKSPDTVNELVSLFRATIAWDTLLVFMKQQAVDQLK